MSLVLFRYVHGAFSITGWGWFFFLWIGSFAGSSCYSSRRDRRD